MEAEQEFVQALLKLKTFLSVTCLSELGGDPEHFRHSANEPESQRVLGSFVRDAEQMVLVVSRYHLDGTGGQGFRFHLDLEATPEWGSKTIGSSTSVAIIKARATPLLASDDQMNLRLCRDLTSCKTILNYVQQCFLPYRRALLERAGSQLAQASGEGNIAVLRGHDKVRDLGIKLLLRSSSPLTSFSPVTLEVHRRISDVVGKCQAEGKTPKVEELGGDVDDVFLNELQQGLTAWKEQILSVTVLDREVKTGTTLEEINFWLSKEKAVHHIYDQLGSVPVVLTFQVLNENKRSWATQGFTAEVGLSENKKEDKVHQYSNFLRDFPIERLLTAPDFAKLEHAVRMIFRHLKQIQHVPYPLERAIGLTHTLSRELADRIKVVMDKCKAMDMELTDLIQHTHSCMKLLDAWDDNWECFLDDLREIKRQKRPDEIIIALTDRFQALDKLKQRITNVYDLRKAHLELRDVVMAADPVVRDSALKQTDAAYAFLRNADVFAVSAEGNEEFARAQKQYYDKVDQVEDESGDKVRELMGQAKDVNEMFRICAKFRALFVRPRIQQRAIREYQEQLIATVKKDIEILQEKFQNQYHKSEARRMSRIHDVPPVSGALIWNGQIQRQLDRYRQRMADLLGKEWVHHVQGKRLQEECDLFQIRLQTRKLFTFKSWVAGTKDVEAFDIEAQIFCIVTKQGGSTLAVNFDKRMVHLSKEVRSLARLGMKMPVQLVIMADETRLSYPCAMQLEEAIASYTGTCSQLTKRPQLSALAAGKQRNVEDQLSKGVYKRWDSDGLKTYVKALNRVALEFRDHVEELITLNQSSTHALERLRTCPATHDALRNILYEIQTVVDRVDKRGFSNLGTWVSTLYQQVEERLTEKLETILQLWDKSLDKDPSAARHELVNRQHDLHERSEAIDAAAHKDQPALDCFTYVRTDGIRHQLYVQNGLVRLEPPLEHARLKVKKGVQNCLKRMEAKLALAAECRREYQALLHPELITELDRMLHEGAHDLPALQALLASMPNPFVHPDRERSFGPIVLECGAVQDKIKDWYYPWHGQLLAHIGLQKLHASQKHESQDPVFSRREERLEEVEVEEAKEVVKELEEQLDVEEVEVEVEVEEGVYEEMEEEAEADLEEELAQSSKVEGFLNKFVRRRRATKETVLIKAGGPSSNLAVTGGPDPGGASGSELSLSRTLPPTTSTSTATD
eukprot:g68737.t1